MTKKTKTWSVVIVCYGDKFHAFTISVAGSQNLFSSLNMWAGIVSASICSSKKDAEHLAEFWNECYQENGTWFYSKEDITA